MEVVAMRKVCGAAFYGIEDILKGCGYKCPAHSWSLRHYRVKFSHLREDDVPVAKIKGIRRKRYGKRV
jgi:hypothetical protein